MKKNIYAYTDQASLSWCQRGKGADVSMLRSSAEGGKSTPHTVEPKPFIHDLCKRRHVATKRTKASAVLGTMVSTNNIYLAVLDSNGFFWWKTSVCRYLLTHKFNLHQFVRILSCGWFSRLLWLYWWEQDKYLHLWGCLGWLIRCKIYGWHTSFQKAGRKITEKLKSHWSLSIHCWIKP